MAYPEKMKAAVLVAQRQPLVIADVDLPQALDVGQVLVKVYCSGICGSQLGEIDGAKGDDKFLPHLLGHEGSGVVVETGPGVRHVSRGDSVVLHWRKGAGIESQAPKYTLDGKIVNAGWVTTFNEYAIVSENRLTKIPDGIDMAVAALFGCAVTTGFGAVMNNAKVKIGDSVLIFGAGGVGLNMIQASSLASAYPIIAVDIHDSRLQIARKLGATHLINSAKHDIGKEIIDITDGRLLDVFIDNTGIPEIIELGYRITQAQGRIILVGVPRVGADSKLFTLPLHFGKSIQGSHGGDANPEKDIAKYLRLYLLGKLKLDEIITHRFPLEEINKAIIGMRSGEIAGRVIITCCE